MDKNPPQSNVPEPSSSAPAAQPNFVGQSNIIDRTNLQASIASAAPAQPSSAPGAASPQEVDFQNTEASSAFAEAKVLIFGVASSTSYILIVYLVKNLWATAIVSAALAAAAIFFAISDYRISGKSSPLTIVGLSAATVTLVYIANILVAQAFIHSALSGYTF